MSLNNNNNTINNNKPLPTLTPQTRPPPLPLPYDTKDPREKVISAFENGLISSPLLEDIDGIVYKWMRGQENVFVRPRKTGKTQAIIDCIYLLMKANKDEDMSFLIVSTSERCGMNILERLKRKVLEDNFIKEDIAECVIRYEYISHLVRLPVFTIKRENGKETKVYASTRLLVYGITLQAVYGIKRQTAIFLDEFQFLKEDIWKNIHEIGSGENILAVTSENGFLEKDKKDSSDNLK